MTKDRSISPKTTIGHVHLKVANIERALTFYQDILGFKVTSRIGEHAVFLAAGGYHHHIGLNTWESLGATPPPPGHTGLYHYAILFATKKDLANVLKALLQANYPIEGASDHGVSEAVYLSDPDGNGIELYWDRPESQWKKSKDGSIEMAVSPLDLGILLSHSD